MSGRCTPKLSRESQGKVAIYYGTRVPYGTSIHGEADGRSENRDSLAVGGGVQKRAVEAMQRSLLFTAMLLLSLSRV